LQPLVSTQIELSSVAVLRDLYPNTTLTPGHYFAHQIPRNHASVPVFGPNASSTQTQNSKCSNTTCEGSAELQDIQFSWPKILTCSLKGQAASLSNDSFYRDVLHWPETFSIQDSSGGAPVTYELVGHIVHSGNHYTARIRIEDTNYVYNDMDASSEGYALLRPAFGDPDSTLPTPMCHVYVRTSSKSMVSVLSSFDLKLSLINS
jgi:hypothetical protein